MGRLKPQRFRDQQEIFIHETPAQKVFAQAFDPGIGEGFLARTTPNVISDRARKRSGGKVQIDPDKAPTFPHKSDGHVYKPSPVCCRQAFREARGRHIRISGHPAQSQRFYGLALMGKKREDAFHEAESMQLLQKMLLCTAQALLVSRRKMLPVDQVFPGGCCSLLTTRLGACRVAAYLQER